MQCTSARQPCVADSGQTVSIIKAFSIRSGAIVARLMLEKRWLPGKCVAWELGYAEVNSFYRAFRRWTGHNYSDLKQLYV